MHVAAIIAAGGVGVRLGSEVPKQFVDLGDGSTMLTRAILGVAACPLVDEVVVALPPRNSFGRPLDVITPRQLPVSFVDGGNRRQDSVANALARISEAADLIVIHDAARPFVTGELVERAVTAAAQYGAAIAAVPVNDTVKETDGDGGDRVIRRTLPREKIFLAQTPQAFKREVLTRALALATDAMVTDEATWVERAGFPVHIVQGDPRNLKVTTPEDLASARAHLRDGTASSTVATIRVGAGYDLHRLVAGRALTLAGVRIPFDRGLEGHSDADIVCHAVIDAVLGGAGLGDIGRMFPDSLPQWKNADSVQLLQKAMTTVAEAGYRVTNVDVTIIAERPKLLPYIDQMRENLARALGVDVGAVGIKGKTNEGIGAIGRGEAMACHAVALLTK